MNIFERVADNTNPHVDQVRGGDLKDMLGELLTVLVDLLHNKIQSLLSLHTSALSG